MYMQTDLKKNDPAYIKEKGTALVAYIYWNHDFNQQVMFLNDLSKTLKTDLKNYLLEEEDMDRCHEFDISGSPTFILFCNGEETGRLLGKADTKTLTGFISNHLTR